MEGFELALLPRTEEANARYDNPDDDPRGPWKASDLSARNPYSKGTYAIRCPGGRVIKGPPPGNYWRYSEEKLWDLDKDGRIWWDVKGTALETEGMIKLDLHLHNDTAVDWKKTLLTAAERRDFLEEQAREHEAQTGKYIRPICLIQVERTGKEQRDGKHIHAEDVREYLHQRHGITADMVAIKTSEKDELKEVDDVGGLLSRNAPTCYIITKQALQEGWDCPFAYVLAVLTNPTSRTALTQLVGRILRQPDGRKTGNRWLDESYVYCFQRKGAELLKEIRAGFGAEVLGDLKGRIIEETGRADRGTEMVIFPRKRFKAQAEHLVLPAFMIKDGRDWRPVHYEPDILSRVPWSEVKIDSNRGPTDYKSLHLSVLRCSFLILSGCRVTHNRLISKGWMASVIRTRGNIRQ